MSNLAAKARNSGYGNARCGSNLLGNLGTVHLLLLFQNGSHLDMLDHYVKSVQSHSITKAKHESRVKCSFNPH